MSRHGRIRYYGSYATEHKEDIVIDKEGKKVDDQDGEEDGSTSIGKKMEGEDMNQEKAGQKQPVKIGDVMHSCRAEGQQQDKAANQNQQNNIKSLDARQSIRRKRFYSEVKLDKSLEEPTTPSKLSNPPSTCCSANCCKDLDVDKVGQELKNEFLTKSKLLTRNKLLSHLIGQGKVGMRTDCFNWKGIFICTKMFAELSGQSVYSITKVIQSHILGKTEFIHGNSGTQKFSGRTMAFKIWMRAFLERNSQSAPDSRVQVLAHWVTKNALYEMYKEETAEPHIALSTFRQYIKSHFGPNRQDQSEPQVRFSKYSSHSVCEQCCPFNAARITCKNKDDLKKINGLKARHFDLVGGARYKMEEIKQGAIQFPEESIIIQIDGMDNSKSYCPRMKDKSKKFVGLLRLPTKIQGCIIYSGNYVNKRKIVFYLNHDQFPQSSNMVVSTIQKLLEVIVKDSVKLPRKLHVFADNCYRENKNRFVISFSS